MKAALINKCLLSLEPEFKTTLTSMGLPPELIKAGIRNRYVLLKLIFL